MHVLCSRPAMHGMYVYAAEQPCRQLHSAVVEWSLLTYQLFVVSDLHSAIAAATCPLFGAPFITHRSSANADY